MVTTLVHGVTALTVANAEAAIVQSAELDQKLEESNVSGMVSGATEVLKTYVHSRTIDFTVSGHGDLTLVPATSATIAFANMGTLIAGGKVTVKNFKYSQKIGSPSEWSYSGTHYPNAA